MHFNDLLMKLRTQALGGVAALSTIVGIFAKTASNEVGWELAAFAFLTLTAFWIAIWLLDFYYYNRLLVGAATTLVELEELSKTQTHVNKLELSTKIHNAVDGDFGKISKDWKQKRGRWLFYLIVFLVLEFGFLYSAYHAGWLNLCDPIG